VYLDMLGWAAALLASSVALPQVIRLFRTRGTSGVSVVAWRLTLGANIAWTLHGVFGASLTIIVPNLLFMVCSVLILVQIGRDRGLAFAPLLLPSLGMAVVAAGLDLALGPIAFAVAAGLPSVLGQLMQLRELLLAPSIGGLSMPFLALNTLNQVLWLTWALFTHEQSVLLVASTLGFLMALNLTWAWLRRTGRVRARLAHLHA
jgi:uncharacterized protein with PQ loop repeat